MQEVLEQSEPLADVLNQVDLERDVFPSLIIKYTTADNNTLGLNNTNVMNLAETMFAKWVTEGGVEAEWDSYVAEMNKAGLMKNLEIMQEYFDAYLADQ